MTEFAAKFRRSQASEETLDLAKIAADDAFVEALRNAPIFDDVVEVDDTHGRHARPAKLPTQRTNADVKVAELLQAWRREINAEPLPKPIDTEVAVAILQQAPPRRRALRPIMAVAAAITGLLIGSAAIGARSATPDDLLWPVTQLLWGDRADSVLAGQTARDGLDSAHQALEAGHPEDAETALVKVTEVITKVAERDGRQTLESEYQSVKSQLEVVTKSLNPQTSTTTAATSQAPTIATTAIVPPAPGPAPAPVPLPVSSESSTAPSTTASEEPPPVDPDTSAEQPTSEPEPPTEPSDPPPSEQPSTEVSPTSSTVETTTIEPTTEQPTTSTFGGLDETELAPPESASPPEVEPEN